MSAGPKESFEKLQGLFEARRHQEPAACWRQWAGTPILIPALRHGYNEGDCGCDKEETSFGRHATIGRLSRARPGSGRFPVSRARTPASGRVALPSLRPDGFAL